jgi:hypothetical protein
MAPVNTISTSLELPHQLRGKPIEWGNNIMNINKENNSTKSKNTNVASRRQPSVPIKLTNKQLDTILNAIECALTCVEGWDEPYGNEADASKSLRKSQAIIRKAISRVKP